MDDICILLTATIDPRNTNYVKRKDPLIRETDYIESLTKLLQAVSYPIIFCENSRYDLSRLMSVINTFADRRVEVIQFEENARLDLLGKGYGELLIIRYALSNSNTINNSRRVLKISGRYFIRNINAIIDSLLDPQNADALVVADLNKNLTMADSRLFSFQSLFIDYLVNYKDLINDSNGFYLEHALSRAIHKALSDGHKWMPLPYKPDIVGFSGTFNIQWETSWLRWFKGNMLHKVKNDLMKK